MQPEDISGSHAPPAEQLFWETPGMFPKVEDERVAFWGYSDLVLLITLVVLIMLAAGVVVFSYPTLVLPIQLLAYVLMYFAFVLIFRVKYQRGVFNSLGWRKTGHSLIAAGLGGILLAFGIGALASLVHTPKVKTPFDDLAKTPFSMLLLAVTAIVFAPLFEEMLFRGFVQPLLSKTFGVVAGVMTTAILFGGLHSAEYQGAWQYVAAITLVGIALGLVRARTNSIIPGTVMHGCFNAVSIVGLLAAKHIPLK
jgi:uncharacterized protein